MRSVVWWMVASSAMVVAQSAPAAWLNLVADDFSATPTNWTYVGVSNVANQALFRHDAVNGRIAAEWDQSNAYNGAPDPQVIVPSRFSRPLPRPLTDRDSFRMGATLRIDAGSIPDTLEFFQVGNFGLYNFEADSWGADRGLSDNYSTNATLMRDANNLIEFNYFINNKSFDSFDPFIQSTLITAMPSNELDSGGYFVTGGSGDPLFHDTDMGADTYLPAGTNLYVEFVYHGAATGTLARRVYCGIYTDAARTNLLTVNGVEMYYWTRPAPTDAAFRVTHAAMMNWPSVNFTVLFGGSTPDGAGAGAYDDVYVDLFIAPAQLFAMRPGPALDFGATIGRGYAVRETADLASGSWSTVVVIQATTEFVAWTNGAATGTRFYSIEELPVE